MTEKEAIEKYNTKWWEKASSYEIVKFQLFEERCCMPFDSFQEAVEEVLGHPVWTHQFGSLESVNRFKEEFARLKEIE